MSAINIIQRVARKLLTQNQPKGVITIPNRMTAESKAGEIAATLQRAGLSMDRFDDFITSETDLVRLLNQIEAFEKKNLADNIRSGIRNTESGKIFEIATGKEIPPGSQIMGGKAMETEAEIAARLQKENKNTVEKIRERKYNEAVRKEQEKADADPNYIPKIIDPEDMADGGRAGFFMGSQLPKGLATLRTMLQYMGKKSDKVKNPSDVLKMVNPKSLNAMLNDPKLQGKVNVKEGILASDMVKDFQGKMGEDRVQLVKDMLSAAKNIKKADTSQMRLKNEMIEDMMKKGLDRGMAEEMATAMSRLAEDMAGKFKDTPKLTDEGILELENVLKNMETGGKKKRDLNADGGRIGLKDGMNRRTFLKLLGGLASIPIIGKIVKPIKLVTGVKNVPIIKTGDVPGKPEWFDQLVNKVIIEGDDVTKRFATQERQVVHMKKIDDETTVTVTQDLNDGSIMVDVDDPIRNVMGESGDDTRVMMRLKKNPGDESSPAGPDEFDFTEADMRNYMDGPDDYTTEFTENTVNKMSDLTSDLGKLKSYATGKKPTMKEFIESKKRQDKVRFAEEKPAEYAAERGPDIDYSDYEYASGGIARMLGE